MRSGMKSKLHHMQSFYVPKFKTTGKPSWNHVATFLISKPTRKAIQQKKKLVRPRKSNLKVNGDAALAYLKYLQGRTQVVVVNMEVSKDFVISAETLLFIIYLKVLRQYLL